MWALNISSYLIIHLIFFSQRNTPSGSQGQQANDPGHINLIEWNDIPIHILYNVYEINVKSPGVLMDSLWHMALD